MADKTATTTEGGSSEPLLTPDGDSGGIKRGHVHTDMSEADSEIFEKHFGEKPEKPEKPAKKTEQPAKDQPKTEKPPGSKKDAPKEPEVSDAEAEEEPSDAAKKKYAEAKKAKDPKTARKLYREAVVAAFGEVPDEFNDAKFAAARIANEKRTAEHAKRESELEERERNVEANANNWIQKLTPAINVLRALQQIRQSGDFSTFGELVAQALEMPVDEALKHFVRGTKVTPEQLAMREQRRQAQAAEAAREKRIKELETKLEERDASRAEAEKAKRIEAKRAAYMEELGATLADHPVLKIERGLQRVYRVIANSYDKVLKAPRRSPEQAADMVVASERRRLQKARHLLDEGERSAPAAATAPPRSVGRTETVDTGTQRSESPEAAFDRIWAQRTTSAAARPRRR